MSTQILNYQDVSIIQNNFHSYDIRSISQKQEFPHKHFVLYNRRQPGTSTRHIIMAMGKQKMNILIICNFKVIVEYTQLIQSSFLRSLPILLVACWNYLQPHFLLHLEILGDRTMVVRSPQGDLTTIVWSSTISNYGLLLLIPKSKPYELKTSLTQTSIPIALTFIKKIYAFLGEIPGGGGNRSTVSRTTKLRGECATD